MCNSTFVPALYTVYVYMKVLHLPAKRQSARLEKTLDINNIYNNLFKSHASVMPSLYRLMSDYEMIYIIIHKRKDNRRLMILRKIVN